MVKRLLGANLYATGAKLWRNGCQTVEDLHAPLPNFMRRIAKLCATIAKLYAILHPPFWRTCGLVPSGSQRAEDRGG